MQAKLKKLSLAKLLDIQDVPTQARFLLFLLLRTLIQ